jgi:ribosome-associated translation inhibitor RaiA
MPIPLRIMDRSRLLPESLAEHIRERTEKFAHFFERVKSCRVTVDGPGQHRLRERLRVRISLLVPGSEIAINRQGGEDLPRAIRAAFDAADRRLEEYVRISRESLKGAKRRPKREI